MPMGHLRDHPAGENLEPELKKEVWAPVQEGDGVGVWMVGER